MGCAGCAVGAKSGKTVGCGGGCSTGGCNKLNVYDWLSDIELPGFMKPFDIVEIAFKGNRKGYYRNLNDLDIHKGIPVVVEADNGGYDIGRVSVKGELVKLQMKKNGYHEEDDRIRKLYRVANEADLARWKECKDMEIPTQYKARSIAIELGLDMKISDVEYQGDKRKATFFYTAEGRVDFRELIKRLAETFRVKIEMRQVSYRDEAGRLGAIGSCGRVLCCSTWLTDFKLVSNSAARYQNLSLNPLKLSGQCGRLKCCLNYELDSYVEALQEFPRDERLTLQLENGTARLQKTDILRRIMWFTVDGSDSGQWIAMEVAKVNEIIDMNSRGEKPAQLVAAPIMEVLKEEEPDFKDMVGEESITRLDNKNRNKKGKGGGRNNDRRNRERGANTQNKQAAPRDNASAPADKQSTDPNKAAAPRRENRERNNNNNRNQGQENKRPPASNSPRNENRGENRGENRNENRNNNRGNRNNRNRGQNNQGENKGPQPGPKPDNPS